MRKRSLAEVAVVATQFSAFRLNLQCRPNGRYEFSYLNIANPTNYQASPGRLQKLSGG